MLVLMTLLNVCLLNNARTVWTAHRLVLVGWLAAVYVLFFFSDVNVTLQSLD